MAWKSEADYLGHFAPFYCGRSPDGDEYINDSDLRMKYDASPN
jgi:hypothetical protein